MKKLYTQLFFVCMVAISNAQIPTDSLYLGQTPPGSNPVIFELPMSSGLRPVERITISTDGTEIYYGELNTYPPTVQRISYFKYLEAKWQGPFLLFNGYNSPALSPNDSIMYMQTNLNANPTTYYSVRTDTGWSIPVKMFNFSMQSHYFQQTNLKNYYVTTIFPGSTTHDLSKAFFSETDTNISNIGKPINSNLEESDFFIARDESFIIHTRYPSNETSNMYISYKNENGTWTNSKSLGSIINKPNPTWEYGQFVTPDNKYLFFTRGDNSWTSYYVYWVKIDNIIDNLKHTNYIPYVRNTIPGQTAAVDQAYSFTFADSTFIDDDGNHTLSYSATLNNNNPLPNWLTFDAGSRTFSGTPTEPGTLAIKLNATDTASANASVTFNLIIEGLSALNSNQQNDIRIYPNPSNGIFTIYCSPTAIKASKIEAYNSVGSLVTAKFTEVSDGIEMNLSGNSTGVYLIKIVVNGKISYRKIRLE